MAHGIDIETVGAAMDSGKQVEKNGRIRNLFSEGNKFGKVAIVPISKPPCVYYGNKKRGFEALDVSRIWE